MKKSFLVLGISILGIIFLVNLMPFDTFDTSSDDVSQVADNVSQQNTESEHDEIMPDQLIETITESDDIITLFNTLPQIKSSFTGNERDAFIGQRLNVTDFKVTSLTWKLEKGGEPAEGTITSQILINAEYGTKTETVVATADEVLKMEDLPTRVKEQTFHFSDAPFLTGEVVFALKLEFTSEPLCCTVSRHQLHDGSAEGTSSRRTLETTWSNSHTDEGLKIEGIHLK